MSLDGILERAAYKSNSGRVILYEDDDNSCTSNNPKILIPNKKTLSLDSSTNNREVVDNLVKKYKYTFSKILDDVHYILREKNSSKILQLVYKNNGNKNTLIIREDKNEVAYKINGQTIVYDKNNDIITFLETVNGVKVSYENGKISKIKYKRDLINHIITFDVNQNIEEIRIQENGEEILLDKYNKITLANQNETIDCPLSIIPREEVIRRKIEDFLMDDGEYVSLFGHIEALKSKSPIFLDELNQDKRVIDYIVKNVIPHSDYSLIDGFSCFVGDNCEVTGDLVAKSAGEYIEIIFNNKTFTLDMASHKLLNIRKNDEADNVHTQTAINGEKVCVTDKKNDTETSYEFSSSKKISCIKTILGEKRLEASYGVNDQLKTLKVSDKSETIDVSYTNGDIIDTVNIGNFSTTITKDMKVAELTYDNPNSGSYLHKDYVKKKNPYEISKPKIIKKALKYRYKKYLEGLKNNIPFVIGGAVVGIAVSGAIVGSAGVIPIGVKLAFSTYKTVMRTHRLVMFANNRIRNMSGQSTKLDNIISEYENIVSNNESINRFKHFIETGVGSKNLERLQFFTTGLMLGYSFSKFTNFDKTIRKGYEQISKRVHHSINRMGPSEIFQNNTNAIAGDNTANPTVVRNKIHDNDTVPSKYDSDILQNEKVNIHHNSSDVLASEILPEDNQYQSINVGEEYKLNLKNPTMGYNNPESALTNTDAVNLVSYANDGAYIYKIEIKQPDGSFLMYDSPTCVQDLIDSGTSPNEIICYLGNDYGKSAYITTLDSIIEDLDSGFAKVKK